ncbi:MAG TPA: valine--tRNA ligase [Candidatus Paceibacterota bacterium]
MNEKNYIEPDIPKALLSPYNPQTTEAVVIDIEDKSGLANPDTCIEQGLTTKDAESFSIILPPPNVTGTLHLGHGLMLTLQDISSRFERMRGKQVLWIPGTDHAAIATQSKVEKDISKKEGKSRYDLGREEMLKRINAFAMESHDTIEKQIKRMGASLDWSREAFTLDETRNKAVRTMFKQMYDDGLIYQGNRLVNWDPKGQTTISDDEIVYEDRESTLYTFKYSKDFPISISTTRPETKIGDVAVAVHPEDERYAQYVGQVFNIKFCGSQIEIKVIADKEVEKDFGTGALGVTPAHSMIDWDMAKRHDLRTDVQVIDEKARMMVDATSPLFDAEKNIGMKTTEAREKVAEWLREQGLMEKEEKIQQRVSTAERTGAIIEPLPKTQWWIAVNKPFKMRHSSIDGIRTGEMVTLKEIMQKAVSEGQINLLPEHYEKTYFNWINNLNDWCISRQIWYGHRIPVWYKKDAAGNIIETRCDILSPEEADLSDATEWSQDEDTLDTWFSSGLWTFSTMGWPEAFDASTGKMKPGTDLARFHPTSILVTGPDIIFFWVARMILMTGYGLGQIPFSKVYFNGIMRDMQGRKMSKSLGNGGDPMEIAEKYGADALRMFYAMATAPGTDTRVDENKIKGFKNFANKIWNITRFVLTGTKTAGPGSVEVAYDAGFSAWSERDATLIAERDELFKTVTKEITEYKYHLASEKIYQYAWSTFADIILEESKLIFNGRQEKIDAENPEKNLTALPAGTDAEKISRAQFLLHTLRSLVTVLHPFMPHVTEELWSLLNTGESLADRNRDTIKPTDLLMAQKWTY